MFSMRSIVTVSLIMTMVSAVGTITLNGAGSTGGTSVYPNSVSHVSLPRDSTLSLEFTATGNPEQVFLLLTHQDSGKPSVLTPVLSQGKYLLSLKTSSKTFKELITSAGRYSAELLVAGGSSDAVRWAVAEIQIDIAGALLPAPKYSNVGRYLPEITCDAPMTASRPNPLIAIGFTALCLLPLGLLIALVY